MNDLVVLIAYLPCVEKVTVSVDNGYCCDVLQLNVQYYKSETQNNLC